MSDRRQERKVVTVLFCDLVGFTQRAEEMDPEDVASMLGPYHVRVKEELERYGGTVEKFIGDAVMALFGAPVAHEDDPERAVRAAFAIRDFADDEGIELRIGITTGEALVTLGARPDKGETMAAGDVVNTAARLQAAAPVNGILVSEKTHDATAGGIEYAEAPGVDAKGKSKPVPAWRALRPRSRITLDRLHGTPLVGRERELDLLVDALARARAERQPQLVTLVGVPGIGKSRLVFELSQAVDRDPELISWRQGRCLPYGEGVTFWALGEIVKAHLGIRETDTADQAERTLRAAVPDEWIQAYLRPLLGLALDGVAEGDRREEAFVAWRRFLEGIAEQRPLALVFEDLHWADEDLLDFLDHLVDWASGVALLVVCTGRPELLERRPGWGGGKTNALTISLSPLTDDETTRLIAELLEKVLMPAETQAALLARAGGNPLYAEQYVRMLEERTGTDLPLPETVQGIIAARLDGLEPEQKALLQNASVVGKVFWLGAVTSISGLEGRAAETVLHALERRGFLRRERESSIEGDVEYAFLHVLAREVAYGQIPRAARSEKHGLAAEWIEGLGRAEDHAEMLAHHYREAIALARAAGLETAPVEEPARHVFRAAGDRATALNAHAAALRFYEEALELWPVGDGERPQLLFDRARATFFAVDDGRPDLFEEARNALLEQGDLEVAAEASLWEAIAKRTGGRPAESVEIARSAARLLEGTAPSPAKARVLAGSARLLVTSEPEEAMVGAHQALEMAEQLGLGDVRANALNTIGWIRVNADDDVGGIGDLEESLRLVEEQRSVFDTQRGYNNLAFSLLTLGEVERGRMLLATALEHAERYGVLLRWPQGATIGATYWSGRWDEAKRRADEYLADEAPHLFLPSVASLRARIRLARDDVAGAAADSARALESAGEDWTVEPPLEAVLGAAELALAEERRADAAGRLDEVFALAGGPSRLYLTSCVEAALLAVELDHPGDAFVEAAQRRPRAPWHQVAAAIVSGDFEAAADRLAELLVPPLEAKTRVLAAQRLVAEDRRSEADVQLQRALAFWRSVGATRYVREGEALLAATA